MINALFNVQKIIMRYKNQTNNEEDFVNKDTYLKMKRE